MLVHCWDSVADGGPTLNQHCFNVSCAGCFLSEHDTFHIHLMLFQCWTTVCNAAPIVGQCVVFAERSSIALRLKHSADVGLMLVYCLRHRPNISPTPAQCLIRILVQVTIYRRLLIGRDGHVDQSEAYDIS